MLEIDEKHDVQAISNRVVTIADNIATALRREILMGRLQPEQKLRVEELKAIYGVSTSTLREALLVLSGESLVQSFRQRGFRVAPASQTDLIDIFENLKIIETEALRRAIRFGGDVWEADIMSAYHLMMKAEARHIESQTPELSKKWEKLHLGFHMAIISECRSPRLLQSCKQLREQALRYRHLADIPQAKHPKLDVDHQPLMEAVLRRDCDEASKILTSHFDTSQKLIQDSFADKAKAETNTTPPREP